MILIKVDVTKSRKIMYFEEIFSPKTSKYQKFITKPKGI